MSDMYRDRSLNNFIRTCKGYILTEREKLAPDNTLISLLEDAVRMVRELAYKDAQRSYDASSSEKPYDDGR